LLILIKNSLIADLLVNVKLGTGTILFYVKLGTGIICVYVKLSTGII